MNCDYHHDDNNNHDNEDDDNDNDDNINHDNEADGNDNDYPASSMLGLCPGRASRWSSSLPMVGAAGQSSIIAMMTIDHHDADNDDAGGKRRCRAQTRLGVVKAAKMAV